MTLDPSTLTSVVRRFPLLGRPRPSCPPLPERVREIADIARAVERGDVDQLNESAHALNKAALIASDCGLPDLARDLCWRHINLYRATNRPLTVLHARYMLEPVVNLARLQLRAHDGDQALLLLTEMFHAVRTGTDLVVEERTLPLTNLAGSREELRKLHEWVWLHLVGDGVRALALAGRWDDAVAHAHAYRGIGQHLMEGRQAMIVARCLHGDFVTAQAALAESTPQQPWELQVASCLKVLFASPDSASRTRDVAAMIALFAGHRPMPGYAFFRAQLGLSVFVLAEFVDSEAASRVIAQVACEAIESRDGYAAREVLRYLETRSFVSEERHVELRDLLNASGLGSGALPEALRQGLLDSAQTAAEALQKSLLQTSG